MKAKVFFIAPMDLASALFITDSEASFGLKGHFASLPPS